MSRLFDGVNDQMVYTSPDLLFGSIVMVLKLNSAASWFSLIEFQSGGGAVNGAYLRHNGGELCWNNGSTNLTGAPFDSSDGWCVTAATKATGTASPNFYKIPIGGSTTTEAGTAGANMFSSVTMRIGGNSDFAAMYLAAVGIWVGTVLSQANIEAIASAKTTLAMDALNPTALYDDSDSFATNLTNPGTFDRTSIVDTTDSGDEPTGWVYGLSAPPGPSHRFMWMP